MKTGNTPQCGLRYVQHCIEYEGNIYSRFSRNSEAKASDS